MATEKSKTNSMYMVLGLGLLLGFAIGFLYSKVQYLEGGNKVVQKDAQGNVQGVEENVDAGQAAPTDVKAAKPDPKKDHWLGNEDAKVVLVEYSDFECPFCGSFYETVKKIEEDYADSVAIVYRHFPLSFHPKADPSAQASECVADLGGEEAFWKMHDLIFEAMPEVEISGLADLAVEAGVDKAAFQTCMDDEKFADKVKAQLDEGSSAGVAATPTSVIFNMETGETEVVEGALPYESVKQTLDSML